MHSYARTSPNVENQMEATDQVSKSVGLIFVDLWNIDHEHLSNTYSLVCYAEIAYICRSLVTGNILGINLTYNVTNSAEISSVSTQATTSPDVCCMLGINYNCNSRLRDSRFTSDLDSTIRVRR